MNLFLDLTSLLQKDFKFLIMVEKISMEQLKQEIKEVIINSLQLEDIKPENIVDAEPLFGE